MPVIDFHAHFLQREVMAACAPHSVLTGFGAHPFTPPPPGSVRAKQTSLMFDPIGVLADMDTRGVDIHVISASTVVQPTSWAAPATQAEFARKTNDEAARWVALEPTRFIGSFTLPLGDIELSLEEIERATTHLRMGVVNLPAEVDGSYLGARRYDPIWEVLADKGVVAFFHPDGIRDPWFQQYSLWNSVGQPIEEAKLLSSLILEGTLDRFPSVPIVISHGGGYLPHYFGRLDRNVTNMPDSVRNISARPSEYLSRIFYDTCVYDVSILDALISRFGAGRLLMGSDYPVGEEDPVKFASDARHLSQADHDSITGGTAAGLLGLDT
jgi:aminocarboxymuconate-semialdehyde decarboxylase